MKILGVTISDNLSVTQHINNIVIKSNQILYALKTLKSNGLSGKQLESVFKSTCISSLTYASPAWRGYALKDDIVRLQSVANKALRWGLTGDARVDIGTILDKADKNLFTSAISNSGHVLNKLLPPVKTHRYQMRARAHNFSLPLNSPAQSRNFLFRMLFNNIY